MTDLVADLVEARLPWVSPRLREWYADGQLREQLRDAMKVEADRIDDEEFGRQFRDGVGVRPDSDPLEWANHRVDLPGGGWAVTGIRFRGGQAKRPFVDVVATTAAPTPDGLARVAATVVPAYVGFAPLCLRVDVPDPDRTTAELVGDDRFGPGCAVDMYVVAGRLTELRRHPRAAAYESVALRRGDTAALAERVAAIYAELTAAQPELAVWATPEDAESLGECAAEGLLFEVTLDGEPAGVVASLRDDDHGMRGFSMQEICLDPAHRGRHLATGVVQRLLDRLPADEGDVLWGTIHPGNLPSLRNALAVGRQVVGGYVWVTPRGLDGMPSTVIR
jgi:hypothetical protein